MKNIYRLFAICALVFLLPLHNDVSGQGVEKVWSIKAGGGLGKSAVMARLHGGGYIVATEDDSTHTGQDGNINQGWPVALTRIQSDGIVQWRHTYESNLGLGRLTGITQTSNGDIVAVGSSFNPYVLGRRTDVWVTRFDSSGNELWHVLLGGSHDDYGYSVCGTADSGCVIAAETSSIDGDITGHHGGKLDIRGFPPHDAWLVKLSQKGEIVWQRCLGGSGGETARGVVNTNDGDYVFCGLTSSQDGDVSYMHGGSDFWIVALNDLGNLLWERTYGGSKGDQATTICPNLSGGYIIVGGSFSMDGDVTSRPPSGVGSWVISIDSIGRLDWQQWILRGGVNALAPTSDAGFLLAGEEVHYDPPYPPKYHGGGSDAWLGKLDSNGKLLWEHLVGGAKDEVFYGIAQDPDGSYVASGVSRSRDQDLAGTDSTSVGWVIKLRERPAGVSQAEFSPSDLVVYPEKNGANLKIELPSDAPQNLQFVIYDLLGRSLLSRQILENGTGSKYTVPIRELPTGFYLCTVTGIAYHASKPFLITR